MTTAGRSMLLSLATSLLTTLPMTVASGEPVANGLARCATIAASPVRLACYDTLAGRAPAEVSVTLEQATPAAAPAPMPDSHQSVPVDDAQNFGLPPTPLHAAPQGLPAIQARIGEVHVDQLRRASVVLDNGQVWASAEGELLLDVGEAVTIRRAALGSFILTSASKRAYHVRRVR